MELLGSDVPGPLVAVGALTVIAALAYSLRTSWAGGAAIVLLLLGGDPEERAASGANEMGPLQKAVLAVTPSAWKKAYLGDNDVERDGSEKLDLPAWQGQEARDLVEPEAVTNVKSMQLEPIEVPSVGPVQTCFMSLAPEPEKADADAPPLLLIHGFDSSLLEFRYIAPTLVEAGLQVEAMEWWTGGFTAREPFLKAVEGGAQPWDLIREHQLAFYKRQLGDRKAVVLGASLGGAVALDFAATHPECVEALILMDAGGESYAQPDPFLTSLAADAVTNLFQWRATNGLLPYPHVWAKEDNWRQALRAYLKSGGYQNRVGPELIKTVPAPTLVLWGEEDDVLPVEDAYKYQQDLPDCVGVTLIPQAQHAPALENPAFVAETIIKFTKEKAWQKRAVAA
eukprot:Transcript_32401.p2 GENE.Transcript_32401~~Transcript_32401.p2  ORF type:complete len:458 (+),score=211.60 Transcript_32401:185-1375(+)